MTTKYLYQSKIYNCSEVTTEAALYGADCSYGYGKTLLFLDELEGGQYVDASDCSEVSLVEKVMYKIERQLSSSESWACLLPEYKDFDEAIKILRQKRKEYPHERYRVIKFEVVEVE